MKFHYKSDFDFLIRFRDLATGEATGAVDSDFRVLVSTTGEFMRSRGYEACRRDGVCHNCEVTDDGIRVFVGSHGLMPGRIGLTVEWLLPDESFPGGVRRVVQDVDAGIELVDRYVAQASGAEVTAMLPYLKCSCDGNGGSGSGDGGESGDSGNGFLLLEDGGALLLE